MTKQEHEAVVAWRVHKNKNRLAKQLGCKDFSQGKNKVVDVLLAYIEKNV